MNYRHTDEQTETADKKKQLLQLERIEQYKRGDKPFNIPASAMNVMVGLCEEGSEPVKVFNWFKDVLEVTKNRETGRVRIDCDRRYIAERMFQYLGPDMLRFFKTRQIDTYVGGSVIMSMSPGGKA